MAYSNLALTNILNAVADAVVWIDDANQVTFFNEGAANLFGYPPLEAVGLALETLLPEIASAECQATLAQFRQSQEPGLALPSKCWGQDRSGRKFNVEGAIRRITIENQAILSFLIRDIGQTLHSQKRILAQRDLAQRLADTTTSDQVYALHLEYAVEISGAAQGLYYRINPATQDLEMAAAHELFLDTTWPDTIIPAGSDRWQALLKGHSVPFNLPSVPMETDPETLQVFAVVPLQEKGQPTGCFVLNLNGEADLPASDRQIIEESSLQVNSAFARIHAEEDLYATQQEFRTIFDSIDDLIFVLNRSGQIMRANQSGLYRLGYTAAELIGKPVSLLHTPESSEIVARMVADMVRGVIKTYRLELRPRRGHAIPVETRVDSGAWGNQRVWVAVCRDISERNAAQEALAESEERFRQMFSRNHEVMLLIDPESGVLIDANEAASHFYGYSLVRLRGMRIQNLNVFTPEEVNAEMEAAVKEHRNHFVYPHRLANGEVRTVEVHSTPIEFKHGPMLFSIIHDISERTQIEDALKHSREQLARAIEGSGVGLWEWLVQTNQTVFNERWAEMLGYTLEEISPTNIETWATYCHPDDLARSNQILQRHMAGETPYYECEVRMRHRDGRWIWVLDRGRVTEWDAQGAPLRVTGTHLDITERRRMENKITYRSRFEELLLKISTRFINLADNGMNESINRALQEIGEFEEVDRSYVFLLDLEQHTMSNTHEWCGAGIEPSIEILQNLPTSMFPWWMAKLHLFDPIYASQLSDFPPEAAAEKEILEAQGIQSLAVIPMIFNKTLLGFIGFDAVKEEKRWTADSIALLQMFSNILSNAMERNRTERALRQSQSRNAALLNAIPDMMFRIRADGYLVDFAAPTKTDLVLPPENIVGQSILMVLGDKVGEQALAAINAAISTGQKQTLVYELPMGSRTEAFEARFVACAPDEVMAIVRNVSESLRLERMKSDFINRATHDLRTPLTTILLMVRLLEGNCTPEEHAEYWKVLKEELDREHTLIEDLLMVGRLESGRWEVKMRRVDPLDALRGSLQTLQSQAGAKDIQINLGLPSQTGSVMGDTSALQQVFTNLISNAIKFTPIGGRVSVNVSNREGKIWFQVSDTGMGIPAEDLPHLFTRFFRGRNAVDQEVSGSGIGLFIVKSIVEQLGGQIGIKSELNHGTTIEFFLPESLHSVS